MPVFYYFRPELIKPSTIIRNHFPFIRQQDEMDCGATCLQMILQFYHKYETITELRDRCFTNDSGASLYSISEAAESYALKTAGFQCDLSSLCNEARLPLIAHWQNQHYVVVFKTTKKYVWVADPALGKIKYSHKEFSKGFVQNQDNEGIILTLEPTADFVRSDNTSVSREENPWKYLWSHMKRYRIFMLQLILAATISSALAIVLPLLTQALVDEGIVNQDYSFIKALIIGQLLLFAGKVSFDALKSWILLHWSYRINISLISSFLMNFLGLSAKDLSSKSPADALQRIEDYQHVEEFITNISINLLLSGVTALFFSILLILYQPLIFAIFFLGTGISIGWIMIFQGRRKMVYYKLIGLMTQNKSKVIEVIEGLQEIKNFGLERRMRWGWEDVQVKEYQAMLQNLKIEQIQQVGFQSINEIKNILIIFMGALSVMHGELSLGAVLAIAFISGQLNSSLSYVPSVFHVGQEAKVSLQRLISITKSDNPKTPKVTHFDRSSIILKNVSFSYDGYSYALQDISMTIPKGKTVAIVGLSGSGKTTLLKLLAKSIYPLEGTINIGETSLAHINENIWRRYVGIVSQDGYIFSETVLTNIAISSASPNLKKATLCAKIANIHEEINELPNGYYTEIGERGVSMSKGQFQRILIARAIYKNPEYLFFDEATSALDSTNEKIIQKHLQKVFKGKTVLIIAHRLSTVKQADNIIVLEKGTIVEHGNHQSLIEKKGKYYHLVKDQLMLGV